MRREGMVVSLETASWTQEGQHRCSESEASRQGHLFAWWMQELDQGLAIGRRVCAEDTSRAGASEDTFREDAQ